MRALLCALVLLASACDYNGGQKCNAIPLGISASELSLADAGTPGTGFDMPGTRLRGEHCTGCLPHVVLGPDGCSASHNFSIATCTVSVDPRTGKVVGVFGVCHD